MLILQVKGPFETLYRICLQLNMQQRIENSLYSLYNSIVSSDTCKKHSELQAKFSR